MEYVAADDHQGVYIGVGGVKGFGEHGVLEYTEVHTIRNADARTASSPPANHSNNIPQRPRTVVAEPRTAPHITPQSTTIVNFNHFRYSVGCENGTSHRCLPPLRKNP